MKKHIAFIGDPWAGSIRRLEAFVLMNPNYKFTFVNAINLVNEKIKIPCESILYSEFDKNNYDLVLTLNDKHFDKILPNNLPNVVDKSILNYQITNFGLPHFENLGFEDNDLVFIKPIIGAGQYTTDSISYRKHYYKDIKNQVEPYHLVQEFIDSPIVYFVTYVCNGRSVEFIDVTEAYHLVDNKGISLNTHLESKIHVKERYQYLIDLGKSFIHFISYNTVPGIYMTQFMRSINGKFYLNDFNVRTGPASDYATTMGIFNHRIHSMIPFIIGDKSFKKITDPPVRYRCYLEKDGVPLSPYVQNINFNARVLCIENKQSGLIRDDYESYLEILT